jgi:hypothetical protein
MGVEAGLGTDIITSEKFAVTFGIKYHYANLIGKSADVSTLTQNKVSLNDASYTYNGASYKATDINYIWFYFNASILLGNK